MIVVCGNMVQDVLARPIAEPIPWGASSVVEAIEQHMGGNGASTSYAIGKLGVPVTLMSLCGRDAAGGRSHRAAGERRRGDFID